MSDGCKCPEWIERCAHFEGEHLFLTDRHHEALEEFVFMRNLRRYIGGRDSLRGPAQNISYFYDGDSHAEAIAAFHEAEGRLIAERTGA